MLVLDIRASRLNGSSDSLNYSLEIIVGNSSSAENVTVGKVLSGEISDRKARENHLGAGLDNGVEFSVDDLPFSVNNGLVFLRSKSSSLRLALKSPNHPPFQLTHRNLVDPDLSIVLLRLQLQLDVQTQDLGVDEALGLLLKSSIREGLLESHSLDQQRVLITGKQSVQLRRPG